MGFGTIIYTILISPLQLFFEVLYMMANRIVGNPGLSIIVLSLSMNFLVLPLYWRADAMQEEERDIENKLHDGVAHIKKTFKGDERMMILQTYYRQNNYKPTDVFKGSISLFLEIPFFIAAYHFLSHLEIIKGVSFGIIKDLGAADALIHIGGMSINLLPIIMTFVNLISCIIFTKGYPLKTKIQLYSMAIFFLFFLYSSPAGLVFYWTLNNLFSLVKTIFYKLKDPKKVLKILFAVVGTFVLIFVAGFYHTEHVRYKLLLGVFGVVCLLPYVIGVVNSKVNINIKKPEFEADSKLFFAGVIYLVALIGAVIPSTVVKTSPQEFADINFFLHPIWYVWITLFLAIGTFAIWFGVFYWLADKEKKPYFDLGIWVFCVVATINYMFFAKKLGNLGSNLKYDDEMWFSRGEDYINMAVIAIIAVICFVIYKYARKHIQQVLIVASIAFLVMAGSNIAKINSSIAEISDAAFEASQTRPEFNLSKRGKNVIVFMLDRAMNEYIPYFINEKPELKEMFAGFTYYPNTISFGGATNKGTPPLYGGYEYTPYEMNKRDSESLMEKQNEALKVMPVIFNQAGYDVTVCDPTYANYQWIPDLSIYDDYPEIATYITNGRFDDSDSKQYKIDSNKRNFFCYSLMKTLPVFAQTAVYEGGNYNNSANYVETRTSYVNVVNDIYTADGIDSVFLDAYSVLQNLSSITNINDSDTNTFMMISNDSTHYPVMMQEPDYSLVEHVDNREFEEANTDRYTVNGRSLKMTEVDHFIHYQTDMASLLQMGKWFDYMRENDIYDNTRIIIVADHGRFLNQLDNMTVDKINIEAFYPLLMVKDFNSKEFTISEEFMTNGDVPTLAVTGLIDNPVNPFTGNQINSDEKHAHDQYVLGTGQWDVGIDNGNTFVPGDWLSVHDDMRDINNWELIQKDSISPFEKK